MKKSVKPVNILEIAKNTTINLDYHIFIDNLHFSRNINLFYAEEGEAVGKSFLMLYLAIKYLIENKDKEAIYFDIFDGEEIFTYRIKMLFKNFNLKEEDIKDIGERLFYFNRNSLYGNFDATFLKKNKNTFVKDLMIFDPFVYIFDIDEANENETNKIVSFLKKLNKIIFLTHYSQNNQVRNIRENIFDCVYQVKRIDEFKDSNILDLSLDLKYCRYENKDKFVKDLMEKKIKINLK